MMSSHSTPNLQQSGSRNNNNSNSNNNTLTADESSLTNSTQQSSSIYTILQNQSGLNFAPISSSFQLHQQIVTLSSSISSSSVSSASIVTTQQQHCDELRTGGSSSCDSPPPPVPPVRDASSLKNIKYGPGHEKYPSWPVAAAAEQPQILRGPPSGGSHRSKSWTDHTNYPKEKVMTYTRPYMKRPNSQQKLKTVMERCEKISSESHRGNIVEMDVAYLPRVDREGKALGDLDYMVPSPPERDLNHKTQTLSQNELDEYTRPPYQSTDQHPNKQQQQQHQHQHQHQHQQQSQPPTYQQLTQADLEEYTRSYEEALINSHHQHQKQPSYAQSEGYHSYVSSTDSMSTPFLDRLRRDSEATVVTTNRASTASTIISSTSSHTNSWDEPPERERDISGRHLLHREGGRDSVVTTSSGSASSSETLKWHGSMSDLSVASSSCTHSNSNNNNNNNSNNSSSKQLIAHSARVKTPQRHNSESVLYIGPPGEQQQQQQQQQPNKLLYEHSMNMTTTSTTTTGWKEREIRNNHQNKLKLFAVNTYTVQPDEQTQCNSIQQSHHRIGGPQSPNQTSLSVADRVSELERQQITRYTYLDPEKKHRVSDPTLKAIQKKALLSFYERHHHNAVTNSNKPSGSPTMSWRSEPQLTQSPMQPKPQSPPPQPPPRPKAHPASRRASSASDYAKGTWRENIKKRNEEMKDAPSSPRHQHSNSCGSLSNDLLGPVIMGPSISVDDWVPERPPKNPHLRTAFPDLFQEPRTPSPDLPPPSPPTVLETEVINNDEPLPPPPSELEVESWSQKSLDISMNNHDDHASTILHKKTEHIIEEKHLIDNNFRQHIRNSTVLEEKHYQHETRQRYSPPRSLNIPNLAEPQIRHSITGRNIDIRTSQRHHNRSNSIYPSQHQKSPHSPDEQLTKRSPFVRSTSYEKDSTVGFAAHRQIPTERTSMRHNPSTQKLVINGRISVAVSQKVHNNPAVSGQFRAEPLRPHHMLHTAATTNTTTTSQQIPAPQVPITNCLMPFPSGCTSSSSDSADNRDFRPRTQSVIENGHHTMAPPLKPRQSKTYQSMRQNSTRQQQTIHHDNLRYNMLTNHHGVMLAKQPIKFEDGLNDGKQSSSTSLSLSQSKASYLSYRRDRERGQPDADYGSYKRIISPSNGNNNHNLSLECTTMDCDRVSGTSEEKWSTNNIHRHSLTTKDSTESKSESLTVINHNNNNNNLLHRLSSSNNSDKKELKLKQSDSPPPPLPQSRPCNLPDVLPVSAKISPPRSLPSPETSPKLQYYNNTNSSSRLSSRSSAVIQQSSSSPQQSPTKESHPILSPVSLVFPLDKRSSVSSTTSSLLSSNAISSKSETSSPKSSLISLSHSPNTSSTPSSDVKEDLPKKCSSTSVTTSPSISSPVKKQPSVTEQLVITSTSSTSTSTSTSTSSTSTSTSTSASASASATSTSLTLTSTSTSSSSSTSTSTTSSISTPTPAHISTSTSTPTHTIIETSSKCDSSTTPQVIEGLQLIQRTEVVLRVNASTTDAASQTDQPRDTADDTTSNTTVTRTPLPTRRKLQEEIECEQLSRDLANQLSPSDKLKGILVPAPEHKKSTDYVSGLFKFEVTSRPRPNYGTYRNSLISISSSTSTTSTTDASSISNLQKSITSSYSEPSSPLSPISTYFTTSESKAKFLTRYSRDMTQYNEVQNTKDLNQKKEELMNRLDRKLEVLRSEQLVVNEESRINDTLGEQVSNYVSRLARPQEIAKYRLHVEEVGKITSLLLGLSGRLARAENALMGLSSDHAERKILEMKRDKLQEQLEEAKKLKENIDRRSINVSNILYKYLNSEEYGDYDHFINMKAKLIMDAREIADKIKLGEEQLTALRETLNIVQSD